MKKPKEEAMKITFVGDCEFGFSEEPVKEGWSSSDIGHVHEMYLECDDILINGESVRKPSWNILSPTKKVRFVFLNGELADFFTEGTGDVT